MMKPKDIIKRNRENIRIRKALNGITKINPHIHNIRIFSDYTFNDLKEQLGNIYIPPNARQIARRQMGKYNNMGYRQIQNGRLKIYFEPDKHKIRLPNSFIAFKNVTFEKLHDIFEKAPDFNVSYVEYAIDLKCQSPDDVSRLFYVLSRYMFFRYVKKIKFKGGRYQGWEEYSKKNCVFKILYSSRATTIENGKMKKRRRKNFEVVVYERGPDTCKKTSKNGKPFYEHKDLDRVRIEFRPFRRGKKLEQIDIRTLKDFLSCPNFLELCIKDNGRDLIEFKYFNSEKLPKYWEDYPAGYESGGGESFMKEYLEQRKQIKNIGQYLEDHPLLNDFKQQIISAIREFDEIWKKRINRN